MLSRWQHSLHAVCQWRGLPWLLFALGIVRNIILLLAYPPALGPDFGAYFMYAERFTGLNIPNLDQLAPPLYPIFVFVTFKVLGSIYWLVGIQFIASALLAPITYLGLRRYSPVLATLASLIVLGDFQTAIVFNFISTEPLYIFLLVVMLYTFLSAVDGDDAKGWSRTAFLVGVLLVLLVLTRAVARYLIIPLAIIMLLRTRDWRRTFSLVTGYASALLLYTFVTLLLFGRAESRATSNVMMLNFFRETGLVSRENGPNSELFFSTDAECPDYPYYVIRCLEEQMGSWDAATGVISSTYLEAVRVNPIEYLRLIWRETMNFLALTGQQYGIDAQTPSEALCDNPEEIYLVGREQLLYSNWGWVLPDVSESTITSFREAMQPVA
jgi:hypothetical protein